MTQHATYYEDGVLLLLLLVVTHLPTYPSITGSGCIAHAKAEAALNRRCIGPQRPSHPLRL